MEGTPEQNFGKQSYYTALSDGPKSNIENKGVRLITNDRELQEVYVKINSTRKPIIEIPEVNWNNQTVIAAFAGRKSTAGYSLEIYQVREREKERIYQFAEIPSSSAADVVSTVITTPYMIVLVNNDGKKITASF
jgi:hypothetical protein